MRGCVHRVPSSFACRLPSPCGRGQPARVPRRSKSEDHAERDRHGSAEDADANIKRRADRGRQEAGWNHRRRHRENGCTKTCPECPSQHGEHKIFSEQLTNDASTTGTECRADRQLSRAAGGTRQQQIRDVAEQMRRTNPTTPRNSSEVRRRSRQSTHRAEAPAEHRAPSSSTESRAPEPAIVVSSALADASETPGFMRPTTRKTRKPRSRSALGPAGIRVSLRN